jgi:hypothetical protein
LGTDIHGCTYFGTEVVFGSVALTKLSKFDSAKRYLDQQDICIFGTKHQRNNHTAYAYRPWQNDLTRTTSLLPAPPQLTQEHLHIHKRRSKNTEQRIICRRDKRFQKMQSIFIQISSRTSPFPLPNIKPSIIITSHTAYRPPCPHILT